MKQSFKFQRVSLFRRVCSIIFDAILCISIFFVLQAFVVQPIFESTTNYYQKYEEYCDVLEDTGLYIYYEEVDGVSIINSKFDERLTAFYSSDYAKQLGYDAETYYKLKWENCDRYPYLEDKTPLFIYSEENGVEKFTDNIYKKDASGEFTTEIDTAKQEKVDAFYAQIVNSLIGELNKIEKIDKLTQEISAFTMLFYILALIPSIIVTYLVFPLVFKDGTTIGKKMLQMRIIDSKSGKNAKKLQLFIRFVYFAVIQIVLGILSYGMVNVISILMIFFNKKRQTIHDMISSTLIVCNSYGEKNEVSKEDVIEIVYDDGKEEPIVIPDQEKNGE